MGKWLLIGMFCLLAFGGAPALAADAVDAQLSAGGEQTAIKPVNVNTASKAQLMTLPGMTEAYADAILENRPFFVKTELRKKIFPAEVFYQLVDLVVVDKPVKEKKQDTKAKKQKAKGGKKVKETRRSMAQG